MAIGFRFEDRFACYVNAESVDQFSININFGMPAKNNSCDVVCEIGNLGD